MAKRRDLLPNLRTKLLLRHLAVKVYKRNYVADITSAKNKLSKWKRQLLENAVPFLTVDKQTNASLKTVCVP